MVNYLGKKALFERLQKLSAQIGCKLPKLKDCEYDFHRGDEWLKYEYFDEESRVEVTIDIMRYSSEKIDRRITRVFINEFMDGIGGDEINVANNTYKFFDELCEYCLIREPYVFAQGRWKQLQAQKVTYG